MWAKLHCDYYVELILNILDETVSVLSDAAFKTEEFQARKSNLESSSSILQSLLLAYREDAELPYSYIKLYGPLIDLKFIIRDCNESLSPDERLALCRKLNSYRKKLSNLHLEINFKSLAI